MDEVSEFEIKKPDTRRKNILKYATLSAIPIAFLILLIFMPSNIKKISYKAIAGIAGYKNDSWELKEVVNLSERLPKKISLNKEGDNEIRKEISIKLGDIIITEIFPNPEGGDTGKEFIELYNTSSVDINLEKWSLKIALANETPRTLIKIGGSSKDTSIIKGGSFFLIGLNKYSGQITSEATRSQTLPNSGGSVYLYDDSGSLFDSMIYTKDMPTEGKSANKKALSGLATSADPTPKN